MKVSTRPGFIAEPASTAVRTAMRTAASTSTPAATITIAPVSILVSRDSWRKVELLANTYRIDPADFLHELVEIVAASPPELLMELLEAAVQETGQVEGRIATLARL